MVERYSRQILFSGIQEEGQVLLGNKHVLVIGAGALGTGNAEVLVRSGVGKMTIVDRDYVEWSNLQRQQLYTEEDAKNHIPKVISAKERLEAINIDVTIEAHIVDITPAEMEQFVPGVDLIMDATDNFEIRMIINDAAQKYGIPWIYGSIVASYGVSYAVIPGKSPCLHCLLGDIPIGGLTCDTGGVISPVVQLVVGHQTAEALKILTENWSHLRQELISFDVWANHHSSINVEKLKKMLVRRADRKPCTHFGLSRSHENGSALRAGYSTDPPAIKRNKRSGSNCCQLSQTWKSRTECIFTPV